MITFDGGYVGLAPVPGGRVNVGIVFGGRWLQRLRRDGAEATVGAVMAAIPPGPDDPIDWSRPDRCDAIEGASPLGVRATLESAKVARDRGEPAAAEALLAQARVLMASDDAREGLMSFVERREGRFTGK